MQPNEGRYSEQNQRSPFTPLNINIIFHLKQKIEY